MRNFVDNLTLSRNQRANEIRTSIKKEKITTNGDKIMKVESDMKSILEENEKQIYYKYFVRVNKHV